KLPEAIIKSVVARVLMEPVTRVRRDVEALVLTVARHAVDAPLRSRSRLVLCEHDRAALGFGDDDLLAILVALDLRLRLEPNRHDLGRVHDVLGVPDRV